MLTVTLLDIQMRRQLLQARRAYADGQAQNTRQTSTAVVLHSGEVLGLEAGIRVLEELEAFFTNDISLTG